MNIKFFLLPVLVFCWFYELSSQTFNYYYGNIHGHTSYSDGNKDSQTSLMTTPLQAYTYAKASQQVDFYGISEHNHKSAGMNSPLDFHQGIADANAANQDGSFVALYGFEWGVISGGGHVLVYGYDSLPGWDAGDYDVYVAQNDYASLWKKINAKPGAFAYLAHPQTTDYTNLFTTIRSAIADSAIIGMAARSGPAFSTNTTYSDPSSSSFLARYKDALKQGYHVGIGLDHDTHYSVFGRQTSGRLVVLAPSLTRANIMHAFRKMRFYSSDDWNIKVDFNIASQPMGSIYTHAGSPTINVDISDPDAEAVSSIKIYYGVPGSGTAPTVLNTTSNSATVTYTHSIANNSTYYYYLEITQADGDVVWTSPIWYTRNDLVTSNTPEGSFSVPGSGICTGQSINLIDNSSNTPTTWAWAMPGASPASSVLQNPSITYTNAGTHTITLVAGNSSGNGLPVSTTVTVNQVPDVVSTSTTICMGASATITSSGAISYLWNTGSTNDSITVSPVATTTYTVTGTDFNNCSDTAVSLVNVQACTGIGFGEQAVHAAAVYPNPANEELNVQLGILPGQKTIEMFTLSGQLILSKTSNSNMTLLDIKQVPNGSYFIKVINNECVNVTKLLVSKK